MAQDPTDEIPPIPPPPMRTTNDGRPDSDTVFSAPSPIPPPPIQAPGAGVYAPDTKSAPAEARNELPSGNEELLKKLVTLFEEVRDDLREINTKLDSLGRLG